MPKEMIDSELLYESYFAPALPHLNEAIIVHSTNKSVRNKVSYPIRAYYEQKCNSCNGYKTVDDGKGGMKSCSTCSGTGQLKFSWGRDYVHELPTTTNNTGVDQVPFPGIGYVSPDGTIITQNEEVIDKWIENAFTFVNIDVSVSKLKGVNSNPTATSSKIDREELFVFMLQISNELFHLLDKFVAACYKVRYNTDSPVVIDPPTSFELTATAELSTELSEAKKWNMPDIALGELTVNYMAQRFSQKDNIATITKVAQYCDGLFTKDTPDIQILLTSGVVQKWQAVLHTFCYTYIEEELLKDPKFLEKDLQEIKDILIGRAKADVTSNQPNSAANIIAGIAAPAAA